MRAATPAVAAARARVVVLVVLAAAGGVLANEWAYSMNEFISPKYNNKLYGGVEVWGDSAVGGDVPAPARAALNKADGIYWCACVPVPVPVPMPVAVAVAVAVAVVPRRRCRAAADALRSLVRCKLCVLARACMHACELP